MARKIDISGQRFGMLTVVRLGVPHQSPSRKQVTWVCLCDCGNEITVQRGALRNNTTQSCGCLRERIYAAKSLSFATRKREYNCWAAMKDRCNNENSTDFSGYGGRGISVCARWMESFDAFFDDMGRRPSASHSIDRIDSNGNYEPGNCRWATTYEQTRNKRSNRFLNFNGKRMVLSDWAKEIGVSFSTLNDRLKRHPTHIALTMEKGSRHVS